MKYCDPFSAWFPVFQIALSIFRFFNISLWFQTYIEITIYKAFAKVPEETTNNWCLSFKNVPGAWLAILLSHFVFLSAFFSSVLTWRVCYIAIVKKKIEKEKEFILLHNTKQRYRHNVGIRGLANRPKPTSNAYQRSGNRH